MMMFSAKFRLTIFISYYLFRLTTTYLIRFTFDAISNWTKLELFKYLKTRLNLISWVILKSDLWHSYGLVHLHLFTGKIRLLNLKIPPRPALYKTNFWNADSLGFYNVVGMYYACSKTNTKYKSGVILDVLKYANLNFGPVWQAPKQSVVGH